ncbi:MAG: serine hydrolase [Patescibacteria group bacterium]
MKKIIFISATIVLYSVSGVLSQTTKPYSSAQIDSLVAKTMAMMPLAGISISVVKDGKVVHSKGYGITHVNSTEKVNENTLFAIASNSKAFTTMALAILVDEGKLTWQDKVADHIPEFKMYDPYVTANFNIQDLLTHRSGLGLGAGDLMFWPDGSNFTMKDILNSFQYQKPVSAFRTKYDYDNLLYIVAGEVVARVSGISWSDFVEKRIMTPLGMTRSVAAYQNIKDKKNVAAPHKVEVTKLVSFNAHLDNEASLGAAGGIYASVADLAKWMLLHLNDGKYGDGLSSQMVSLQNLREMQRPHTFMGFNLKPMGDQKNHFAYYGLGWVIIDLNGYAILNHGGGLPGMLSRTTLVPELNLGVMVLTNTDPGGYAFQSISRAIYKSYMGIKPDEISPMQSAIKEGESKGDSVTNAAWNTVKANANMAVKHESYIGTYRDNWFGEITIASQGNDLWFTSKRSPKLHGKMFFYKDNTFAIKWDYQDMNCDAFATFILDDKGNTVGIKMKGISPNIDFSFDFHDLDLKRVK